jgi:Type II CAAX prenyl endopeptidase Rce1-like
VDGPPIGPYAVAMTDENQADAFPPNGLDPLDRKEVARSEYEGLAAPPPPEPPGQGGTPPPEAALPAPFAHPNGLVLWLAMLSVLGIGGLLAGQQEMAALVAFAGVVMAAQAADLDPTWRVLYWLVGWVVPIGGAVAFASTAWMAYQSGIAGTTRIVLIGYSIGAALLSLLTLVRGFTDELIAVMFRGAPSTHSLRLASRVVLLGLLFAVPGYFVFPRMLEMMGGETGGILENVSMGGELVGYVVVALAAVGFLLRRDLRATLERLGIQLPTRGHLGMVAAGLGALVLFNSSAEWIQHRFFPDLWTHDHDLNERLTRGLGVGKVLMLGLTAGVGEEITLRGALQPRLGLVLTSLLFAALHVQYSWFGMLVIFILGLLLGIIRQRTSTTVAMTIHVVYDMLAVFSITTTGGP